jgi:hypothetical protein
VEFHKWSESEAQAMLVGLRKGFAQDAVEQESGLEVGASGGVFNRADPITQVKFLRSLFDRTEQALQAAAQVGGFADVGLGVGILAAQKENRGADRNAKKNVGISLRVEFQALSQH